jgi:hypothetical protein
VSEIAESCPICPNIRVVLGGTFPYPIIIISKPETIAISDEVRGVVASHTAAKMPDWDDCCVHLPHVPGGSPRCVFGKETVAVCRWIVPVKQSETNPDDIIGFVQLKHLEPVIAKARELLQKKREEAARKEK